MSQATLIAGSGTTKVSRDELRTIPAPEGTRSFKPIPHAEIVDALVEALGFRHIGVVRDEYAVSTDGMKMFGVLDLETAFNGCRFAIGLRNANDRSMRFSVTTGYRVFVCRASSLRSLPSIRRTFQLPIGSRSESIVFSGTSNRSGSKLSTGSRSRSRTNRRSCSSIEHSLKRPERSARSRSRRSSELLPARS